MDEPRIGFCITCRGRADHVKRTLPQNLRDNRDYPNVVFVLLDYGSPDDLRDYIRQEHGADLRSGRLVLYSYAQPEVFRMAHAKNMAHRLGLVEGANVLVNLDADNFTGEGFAAYLAEGYARDPKSYWWARMIHRCNAPVGDGTCGGVRHHAGPHAIEPRESENDRARVRGVCGRVVIPATAFLRSGGYDEARYNVWGPDDRDFNARIELLGYVPHEIPGRFLDAIHHGQQRRFREYPYMLALEEPCYPEPMPVPKTAVVNFGRIGCGTVSRNLGMTTVALEPIPTRIFGIGMHKTGTTSLAKALTLLGYETLHWRHARQARDIYESVIAHGTSPILERHDAACDFPVAILFRELDRAYPGSKFILTTRDERDWLESVRNHWTADRNPWRRDWDDDCFTHRLHTIIYGRKAFDAEIMRSRYRKHVAEVLGYFWERPGDLLTFPTGTGWGPLCRFLDRPQPTAPYPALNATPAAA